jgi:undecaprenyl pyrophosphate phosphatase UppP
MSPILKVLILAIVQGLAGLLLVSSSAQVVVAEKLLGTVGSLIARISQSVFETKKCKFPLR